MLVKAFNSWINGYKQIFCYSGRSTRSEFGFFLLIQFVFMIAISVIIANLFGSSANFLAILIVLLNFLTTLSYNVRRLHDGNFTGWFCLFYLVFAPILIIASLAIPPTVGENKYGADPRQA